VHTAQQDYLSRVQSRLYVIGQCCLRVAPTAEDQRALLAHGLRLTEAARPTLVRLLDGAAAVPPAASTASSAAACTPLGGATGSSIPVAKAASAATSGGADEQEQLEPLDARDVGEAVALLWVRRVLLERLRRLETFEELGRGGESAWGGLLDASRGREVKGGWGGKGKWEEQQWRLPYSAEPSIATKPSTERSSHLLFYCSFVLLGRSLRSVRFTFDAFMPRRMEFSNTKIPLL